MAAASALSAQQLYQPLVARSPRPGCRRWVTFAGRFPHPTEWSPPPQPTTSISYDYVDDGLYLDWHGNLDDETVMAGAPKPLGLLPQQRCVKVLNNSTRVSGLWADAAQWGSDVFFPQLHAAGCRYFSWVHSPERYSQLSAELAVQQTAAGITFMTFRDLAPATAWLRSM